MDIYSINKKTWDHVADKYQEKFMDLDIYNCTYDYLCEQIIIKNASVLEIGCGPGNITRYVLNQLPQLNYIATDVSINMIELAKQNVPNAIFKVMDARDIKAFKEKFDAIICGFCLPYLTDADSINLMQNCSSLLNSKGVLYLSFVEGDKLQSGIIKSSSGEECFFNFYSLHEINNLLEKIGFEIIKKFEINYERSKTVTESHVILIAKSLM